MSLAAVFLLAWPCLAGSRPGPFLENENLRADFAGVRLVALTDLKSGFQLRLSDESFSLTVDGEKLGTGSLRLDGFNLNRSILSITYKGLRHKVNVLYELRPGWRFLTKQIAVEPTPLKDLRIAEVKGFAAGMERLMMVLTKSGKLVMPDIRPMLFIATNGLAAQQWAFTTANVLRLKGFRVEIDYLQRSLKAQMREANRQEARYALVIGETELQAKSARLKNMQTGEEKSVSLDQIGSALTTS